MQGRLRLLLIVAFVIVIGALIYVFVVLPGTDDQETAPPPDSNGQTTQATIAPAATAVPTSPLVEIVVAQQRLARGVVIPPNAVALVPWPEEALPSTALFSLEDVVGLRARTDIVAEQPILGEMVVEDLSDLAAVGSDLAATIPSGLVAVAVPIDRLTSVAYGIQPGDRVDIIISALFVDIDEEFQSILPNNTALINITASSSPEGSSVQIETGAPVNGRFESIALPAFPIQIQNFTNSWPVVVSPREEPRPRLATQRTIQDAQVMWVGDLPSDGRIFGISSTPTPVGVAEGQPAAGAPAAQQGNATVVPTPVPPRPDIVTLAVTPQDAVVLTYFIEARIPITFALRAASDTSQSPTVPVTLDYILSTYNIETPDKLTYSLQPAIRSIRQLVAGQTIQLDDVVAPAAP